MPIQLAVNEPQDLDLSHGLHTQFVTTTSTSHRESGVTRMAFYSDSSVDLTAGISTAPAFALAAPMSEGWVHTYMSHSNDIIYRDSDVSFALMDTNGDFLFGIRRSPVDINRMGFIWHGGVAEHISDLSGNYTVDIYFRLNAVDGFIYVFQNETLMWWFEGDTATGRTNAAYLAMARSGTNTGSSYNNRYSQIIVADENTLTAKLYNAPVTGNGTEQAWTGTYIDVDETGLNDIDFVASDTALQEESFTLTVPGSFPENHSIAGIFLTYRSQQEISSPVTQVQPYLRIGGTQYNVMSAVTPPIGPAVTYNELLTTNPADAAPFELADLSGLELGFRSLA